MHVQASSTRALTVNSSILTANNISCAGRNGHITIPITQGVYLGLDKDTCSGIDICIPQVQYIGFNVLVVDV